MADLRMRLTADDETAAAFASAEQKQRRFAKGSNDVAAANGNVRNSMLQAGAAAQGLTGALNGNIGALDNIGTSLGAAAPSLMKFGLALAAVGIAAQSVKALSDATNLGDRIKAMVDGVDVSDIRKATEKAEKAVKDAEALAARQKAGRAAAGERRQAEIEADPTGGPLSRRMAAAQESNRRQLEQIDEAVADARRKESAAREKYNAAVTDAGIVASKEEQARLNQLKDEFDRAKADADAAAASAMDKTAASMAKLAAETREMRKELSDLRTTAATMELDAEISRASTAIANAEQYIERYNNALKGMQDKRTEAIARVAAGNTDKRTQEEAIAAMGGGKEARAAIGDRDKIAEALKQKQGEVAALDVVGQRLAQRRDPEARQQARDLDRERRRVENRIERVQERAGEGRTLGKWEKDLLDDVNTVRAKRGQEDAKRADEEKKRAAEVEKKRMQDDLAQTRLTEIRDTIAKVMQAAGD